jgi:cobalt/nickel transport system permease protein
VSRFFQSCYRGFKASMHIPDGFLSTPVWAALDVVSLPAVGLIARKARAAETESRAPLLGVLGAFVFAAQMVNFPIAPGTSAHLLGGALLSCTVGPAAAVLVIQSLVFQDGGLLALGANIFNLGLVGCLAAYLPYALLANRARTLSIFLAGAVSVFASGLLALAELMVSGVPIAGPITAVAIGFFAVSAVLEGAITVAVLRGIERINPNWIRRPEQSRGALAALATTAVVLATAAFAIASAQPDSLQRIGEAAGLSDHAVTTLAAPFAEYQIAGISSEALARASAGLAGLAFVYAACAAAARVLRRSA